jgi:hypothetical protein
MQERCGEDHLRRDGASHVCWKQPRAPRSLLARGQAATARRAHEAEVAAIRATFDKLVQQALYILAPSMAVGSQAQLPPYVALLRRVVRRRDDDLDRDVTPRPLVSREPGGRVTAESELVHDGVTTVVQPIPQVHGVVAAGPVVFEHLDVFDGGVLHPGYDVAVQDSRIGGRERHMR